MSYLFLSCTESNFLRMTNNEWIWLEKTQQGEHSGQIVQQQVLLNR